MVTTAVRDGKTEDGALQIWLTPHGFLKGAAPNAATLTAAARDRNGALALAKNPLAPILEGVGDRKVLTDGTPTVELLHLRGNPHSEGLLTVYLPKERLIVEADQFSPRPVGITLPWSPVTTNFYENIHRLKLDVVQMVHVHGRMDPIHKLVTAANLPH